MKHIVQTIRVDCERSAYSASSCAWEHSVTTWENFLILTRAADPSVDRESRGSTKHYAQEYEYACECVLFGNVSLIYYSWLSLLSDPLYDDHISSINFCNIDKNDMTWRECLTGDVLTSKMTKYWIYFQRSIITTVKTPVAEDFTLWESCCESVILESTNRSFTVSLSHLYRCIEPKMTKFDVIRKSFTCASLRKVYVLISLCLLLDVMKCIIIWSPISLIFCKSPILVRNETNDKCHLWVIDRGSTGTYEVLYYPRSSASEVWKRYCSSRTSLLSRTKTDVVRSSNLCLFYVEATRRALDMNESWQIHEYNDKIRVKKAKTFDSVHIVLFFGESHVLKNSRCPTSLWFVLNLWWMIWILILLWWTTLPSSIYWSRSYGRIA